MTSVVQCKCGARFAAEPQLAGQTVNCPKCGQPLAIPEESPATPPPPKGRSQPAKQPEKEATAASGNKMWALIGGAAVVVLALGVWGLASGNKEDSPDAPKPSERGIEPSLVEARKKERTLTEQSTPTLVEARNEEGTLAEQADQLKLGYLPKDTKAVVHLRIGDVFRTEGIDEFLPNDHVRLNEYFEANTGLPYEQIETVTVAFKDIERNSVWWNMQNASSFLGVVHTAVPYSKETILSWLGKPDPLKYNGTTMYALESGHGLFFPTNKTIVFGTLDEVKAAIDSDGTVSEILVLELINPKDHMSVAKELSAADADLIIMRTGAKAQCSVTRFSPARAGHERVLMGTHKEAKKMAASHPLRVQLGFRCWTEGPVAVVGTTQMTQSESSGAFFTFIGDAAMRQPDPLHRVIADLKSDDEQKRLRTMQVVSGVKMNENRRVEIAKLLLERLANQGTGSQVQPFLSAEDSRNIGQDGRRGGHSTDCCFLGLLDQ
ncbi:MAG: hypothetical protein IH991_20550 [Planctomycetes bacterium]|nr:hypothetical protein [Planctomycetota bacterium]